jgi:hypothetical protein
MTTEDPGVRLRRYLLGAATAEECDATESDYFTRSDALDAVREAEDDLVERYLSGGLSTADRERFERHYLSTPAHRNRLAVIAGLRDAAAGRSQRREVRAPWWRAPFAAVRGWSPAARLAVAGALVIVTGAGVYKLALDSPAPYTVARRTLPADPSIAPQPQSGAPGASGAGAPSVPPGAAPPAAPRTVLAVSLAPILVRGAGEPASLAIASGTDIVRLELQGEAGGPSSRPARAIVTTVSGDDVWRGPAVPPGASSAAAIARVDVPAARLRADDYVVTLFAASADGRETELYRYFLRVRQP